MPDPFFMNQEYLENAYEEYLKEPSSVPQELAQFFRGVEFAHGSLSQGGFHAGASNGRDLSLKVFQLIDRYKRYGHYAASTNPLKEAPAIPVELSHAMHGIDDSDLQAVVPTFGILKTPTAPLHEVIEALKKRYFGNIGFEYMHITDASKVVEEIDRYIIEELDQEFSEEELKKIYTELRQAESFESFLHKRHMGKKRFSLEGADSLIPMLEHVVAEASKHQVEDIVIGMAHRGRLNVLAHVLGKEIAEIFHEFESEYVPMYQGSGDVKYHMGYQKKRGEVQVTLAANPSHLESVDPVVLGMCRAKQDLAGSHTALPITIHGDAAVAGQGVVYETLQAIRLDGYEVGGGLHIVINNQVGFTANPDETRSTCYCTDIAKTFSCPVFHVNAMDPVSCIKVTRLALRLARKFHIDVFIDLIGFRKYGHNEGDEPGYTQPLMNEKIRSMPLTSSKLPIDEKDKAAIETKIENELEEMYKLAQSYLATKKVIGPKTHLEAKSVSTTIPLEQGRAILKKIGTIPSDFNIHPRLRKIIEDRGGKERLDWAMAEAVAFGSLLEEGILIRLSGEDCKRGTFSHRHATFVDQKEEKNYTPLNNLSLNQAPFTVLNSYLSEYAVMGYEYGYTLMNPRAMVIWEGQFGDFFNGAQIIIDQYLASGETKWGVTSGLVLYLPHGFEGQGPEHSSARIERFLELAAESNYRCVIPTNTGQMYHLLRGQGLEHPKRPLVIFTPKSLLRDEISFSPVEVIERGHFQALIEHKAAGHPKTCVFSFGKIAYDILRKIEATQNKSIQIISIEQLYPLDLVGLKKMIEPLKGVERFLFVQDEPKNMGAYPHLRPKIESLLEAGSLKYVGRKESSSPATGSLKISNLELEEIMKEIFHG
ncbi:MAG: 2-oxoglutarate dehydrogenase E1 component [Chlamydiia bacterium]